jgi:hypothetical protein
MSQSSRRASRKKPEFDPNEELDEFLSSPHTKVSLGFLGYPNEEDLPLPPDDKTAAVVSTSPDIGSAGAEADLASSGVVAVTSPVISTPPAVMTLGDGPIRPGENQKKIWRCLRAQDGHSHVEQLVYQVLWNQGTPQPDGSRLIRIGLSQLAGLACVSNRRISLVVRRLLLKRSIEIIGREVSTKSLARTYRVLPEEEILLRRREAGLEWVVRRRGVEFVNPQTGAPLFSEEDLEGVMSPDVISSGLS